MQLSSRLRLVALQLTLALATSTMALPASAAPSSKFDPQIEVQGNKLQLNGAGTRTKFFVKVYDMGLYTTRKVGTPEELLALAGPKRLAFTALRELPGTELGRLFVKGLAENSPEDQVRKHTMATTRLIEIFSAKNKLMPGDTFAMEFVPGKGTQFVITGQPQGEPVGDDEFFQMVLKVWVGKSPADRDLRDALLGKGS